jgi:DICT domain-containing protein
VHLFERRTGHDRVVLLPSIRAPSFVYDAPQQDWLLERSVLIFNARLAISRLLWVNPRLLHVRNIATSNVTLPSACAVATRRAREKLEDSLLTFMSETQKLLTRLMNGKNSRI